MDPLLILLIGLLCVIGLIVYARLNPFLALLIAALVVSFLAKPEPGMEGDWTILISRVGTALGEMAGKIMILIAMGSLIGQAMTRSGAADRIVQGIVRLFGRERMSEALLSSGFILSIPVFYDATFYLLLPLARAMYRMTQKNYVLYLLAIGFGATLSHTLIPPTPGPLMVAKEMHISIGTMMLLSGIVGLCTMPFALLIARFLDRRNPGIKIEDETIRRALEPSADIASVRALKSLGGAEPVTKFPSFFAAVLPILLPVVLIAGASITKSFFGEKAETLWQNIIYLAGDAQVALMLSAFTAFVVLQITQKLTLRELEKEMGTAFQAAGTIILITSAGGAFGAMLRACGVGERIEELMVTGNGTLPGLGILLLAFVTASMIKTAQGSSTTAMITTASIFSTFPNLDHSALGFNPGYVAVAIGVGSCVTGWMNDSGFCIFASMSGLGETNVLKTWTVGLTLMGIVGICITMIMSQILPMI